MRPAIGTRAELSSVVDLLQWRASRDADRPAYTFLPDDGRRREVTLCFRDLAEQARAIATLLERAGVEPGDRALLVFPQGLEYITAFFGCLYAGVVAVTAYPPGPHRPLHRLQAIARDSQPAVALTTSDTLATLRPQCDQAPSLGELQWLVTDETPLEHAKEWQEPLVDGSTIAFLQYTSGSTSTPKGVIVTHGNVLHNEQMLQDAFGHTEESTYVSWLPLYHDMGLIGNVLQTLYVGAHSVLLSPIAFLQEPLRWLGAIARFQAHTSGAPNFAYDYCVRKISPAQRKTLDLSSWTLAFNGSEPVRAETLEAFATAFAPYGFRRQSFYPCYGLAEATLFVSGGSKSEPPVVVPFSAAALEEGRVVLGSAESDGNIPVVGCGRTWRAQRILIVDPHKSTISPPDQVGEIWVSGPHIAQGYWNRPDETRETFGGRIAGSSAGPFLRTGDLGFLHEGELFVTGRIKDLIIIRGRNLYPQDIELTVERSHPALRAGRGAAFSIPENGEERLVVVQELDSQAKEGNLDEVCDVIRRAVSAEHEVPVHAVALIEWGTLPRTSSGKIQRRGSRDAYLGGTLKVLVHKLSESVPPAPRQNGLLTRALRLLEPEQGRALVESYLQEKIAAALKVAPSQVDRRKPVAAHGLDSINAVELQHSIEGDLGVSFSATSVLAAASLHELAAAVLDSLEAGVSAPEDLSLPDDDVAGPQPLSYGQRALWFLHQLAPTSAAYNVAYAVRIRSSVDAAALRDAFQALIGRHASLRSVVLQRDGEPVQQIRDAADVDFHVEDASRWSDDGLRERVADEAHRPFDLERGPLARVSLFSRGEQEHVLLLAFHHIVVDLWSLVVLMEELSGLYAERTSGRAPSPLASPVPYGRFARWQARMLASATGEQHWAYWQRQLHGRLPVLQLGTERPRRAVPGDRGASRRFALDGRLATALKRLAQDESTTVYVVLLAAFQALLHRYSGDTEILIGSPMTGRTRAEFNRTVGYFVNMAVLRGDLSGDPSFRVLLSRLRQTVLAALEHQDYPFPLLVERLQPNRDPSRSLLFQVAFVLQRAHGGERLAELILGDGNTPVHLGGLDLEPFPLEQRAAQFDLTLVMVESEGGLSGSFQYNSELFDAPTVSRLAAEFETLLAGLAADPGQRLSQLPLLSDGERQAMLVEWNDTAAPPAVGCVHELIEAQVERTPDALAVISGEAQLTYRALDRRANQLAAHLRQLGVGPEVRVAVCLERGAELVVALLGVLKAGGAYVPLDPEYPAERLRFMLADAQVAVLLTQQRQLGRLPPFAGPSVCVDGDAAGLGAERATNLASPAIARNLSHVIYTSGSTGQPKGVAIEHRSVVTLLQWSQRWFTPAERAAVLAATSVCFDLSVWELFVPLSSGGTVIVVENALALPHVPAAQAVTLINTVPSAIAELVRLDALPASVRTVNLAGEPLKPPLVDQLYARPTLQRVCDLYGPSEDTTYSTATVRTAQGPNTIGRPLAETQIYLLDRQLGAVPLGVAGELSIGGAGLSRGYLNRPEATAERFRPQPFGEQPGARLYLTGDLARYAPDGTLEFLGRRDHQVKVRGYRIELGEIEVVLGQHPGVQQAVVLEYAAAPGDTRLVAYWVARPGAAPTLAELRRHLGQTLPAYMVPASFVQLAALPLTPNGKVDRRALPAPDLTRPDLGDAAVTPRTADEEMVAHIWRDVLGLDDVGVHDGFFDLGGHSLLATKVISRVRDVFQVELPLQRFFEAPTVAGLVESIEAARRSGPALQTPRIEPLSREQPLPLSYAQERLWVLDQLEPGSDLYNVPAMVRMQGPLDVAALEDSLSEIVRRHESLRTSFSIAHGRPVQVAGVAQKVRVSLIDLRHLSAAAREHSTEQLLSDGSRRPFQLSAGPLFRVTVLRLGLADHVLQLVMHHIICDGWSMGVLVSELSSLYKARTGGGHATLPSLPIQYADFAHWQRQSLQGPMLDSLLAYWRERLRGPLPKLGLATARPQVETLRAATETRFLGETLTAAIYSFSRREGVTPFMTLLACFQMLLQRHSGQQDVVVGTDIANRNRSETEGLIGFFVNLLVLRTSLDSNPTFRELLQRVRQTTLGAYAHQDLPFEKLVQDLQPERQLHRTPLFEVLFVLQNAPLESLQLAGLRLAPPEVGNERARFDLAVFLFDRDGQLEAQWVYNTDLFQAEIIQRMAGEWETVLASAVAQPDARLDAIEFRTRTEVEQQARNEQHHREAKMAEFPMRRRRSIDLSVLTVIKTRYAAPGQSLPLIIEPAIDDADLVEWAAENREYVEKELLQHGALLFRGFDVRSINAFERFANALVPELFANYGDLPQEPESNRVYQSTPYPTDKMIHFHNESSHMDCWPRKQWFYCVTAAPQGGETPLVDCRRIYELLDAQIRDRFERYGVMYTRHFTGTLDVSWESFFHTTDRAVVEAYCRKGAIEFEWTKDNGLKTRKVCPAVINHPRTGQRVFFNQIQVHHVSCLDAEHRQSVEALFSRDDLPRNVYYGDGTPIEDEVMHEIMNLYQKVSVSLPWQASDIMMLDNMLVAHARNPFVGPRKIAVALAEMVHSTDV